MKVLFLTSGEAARPLADWLGQRETLTVRETPVSAQEIAALTPDLIVSHSYRHILKRDVLAAAPDRFINLHISLLPYNRGADPNLWSFIDETPKGVSIHLIDEGIDTGALLLQREVSFDEDSETLGSSYATLQQAIGELFMENWSSLRDGRIAPRAQSGAGTFHRASEFSALKDSLLGNDGWNVPIPVLRQRYRALSREAGRGG
ncbi:formyl transferase domain-containing protein [Paraburkholderia hospita]|jgi:methionyl-tRNA formyltransferase|uniref:Formyl transferase domain-containing protein n=1 Tax=Paraburkholderia hospita TaxID=169430 RepID=A0ABP2PQR0_9BURK|nr:formyltransferase family protein [Paraburkholderia hospita]EIN00167.1 formyl transferase domain-containing protein [Paraburkholderia hospita]OUL71426.1 formyl transferase [Paraburkholderia hospita]SKC65181.1 Formyl transferase [Burkholderia sp. CF099]